jgi:phospholipid-binding lipoprotein MlaA
VRDAAGFGIELSGDLVQDIPSTATRNSLTVLRAVETRANLLRATSMLDGAALDKYSFTRDVYLRRRQSQIEDLIDLGIGVRNGTEDTESNP